MPPDETAKPPDSVLWCLRGTVALQSIGAFWSARIGETSLFEWLWLRAGVADIRALWLSEVGAWTVLLAGLAVLWRPRSLFLYIVAVWFGLTALADTMLGGGAFSGLALPTDAVRVAAPLTLAWMTSSNSTVSPTEGLSPERLLAVAVAATFAAHGWEAYQRHPRFADYLFVASEQFTGHRLSPDWATTLLTLIGLVDLAVAIAVASGLRWRPLWAYMAFWGGLTALARVVHGGWWGLPQCLVRTANAGAPWALYLATRASPTESWLGRITRELRGGARPE